MSAIVCGKRSFFDELQSPSPVKKIRCSSSTSPVRFSPPPLPALPPSPLNQLREIFPNMDNQVLKEALGKCGNNLDAATKMLRELSLVHQEGNPGAGVNANEGMQNGATSADGEEATPAEDPYVQMSLPSNGAEWVQLIVREMQSASSIDNAGSRAARVLENFEKSIVSRFGDGASPLQKENMMLKEQLEVVLRENGILKRAVAIQHERNKEYDERVREVQQLKQLLTQYQEQLRTLEVNNYALAMHLRQAQQSNSITGHRNPDVF